MNVRPIDWTFAVALSLAVHVGVAGMYWSRPDDLPAVARRAGGMSVIDGGLVNSAASDGAASVTPSQVSPVQPDAVAAVSAQAVAPAQTEAVAAEAVEMADTNPVAVVAAIQPDAVSEAAPASVTPVAPPTAKPVERKPEKQQPVREKRNAPASSTSDTAGSRSRSQQRAAQAGSGGSERAADGKAAESGYASRVIARIQRAKRCTSALRSARARGTAYVRFSLNRAGRLTAAQIVRRSGSAVIDREALSLVRRAGPYPAFPAAIRKSALSYTVPITYRGC